MVWRDFILGLGMYAKSFAFVSKHRLTHFYLYPIAFILIFSLSAFFGIRALVDAIEPWLNDLLGVQSFPAEGFFDRLGLLLKQTGRYVIHAVIWVSLMFVYYKVNKYIVLIVMSPVMAVIAERTDQIVTGRSYPISVMQIAKDALRGAVIAIRNAVIELAIMVLLLALNLLITVFAPPLTVVTTPLVTVLLFFVGAYFYGFSTIDYSNERYKLSFRESIALVRRNKGIALANGTVFTLWLMVPVFGTYVGTVIAPITCTVGATLALLDKKVYPQAEVVNPTS